MTQWLPIGRRRPSEEPPGSGADRPLLDGGGKKGLGPSGGGSATVPVLRGIAVCPRRKATQDDASTSCCFRGLVGVDGGREKPDVDLAAKDKKASPNSRRASSASQDSSSGKLLSVEVRLREILQSGWWSLLRRGPSAFRCEIEECLAAVSAAAQAREAESCVDEVSQCGSSRPGSRRASTFQERRQGSISRAPPQVSPIFKLLEEEDGDSGEELMTRKMTDCRRWLVQSFTDADLSPVDGHEDRKDRRHGEAYNGSPRVRRTSQEIDDRMTALLQDAEAMRLLERAGEFDFDAISFSKQPSVMGKPLQCLGYTISKSGLADAVIKQGLVKEALGDQFNKCLTRFLGRIDDMYGDVPYHNSEHAADVLMTMEWALKAKYMRAQVSTLDHLMVMVASAIHDVGHPGRNNLFLIKTMHTLAINYNDKSVLENMHLAKSFEIMRQENDTNWFRLLQRNHRPHDSDEGDGDQQTGHDLQQYMRRGLIDMVLSTDMAKHADHVRKLDLLAEDIREERESEYIGEVAKPYQPLSKRGLRQEALEKKMLLLESMLHAADISNPCRARPIMLDWTARVLTEFWAQGDEERSLGLDISPLCDREAGKRTVAKGQIGFITFVIQPLYTPLAEIVPEVKEALDGLKRTRAFWAEMEENKVPCEEIFPSLSA